MKGGNQPSGFDFGPMGGKGPSDLSWQKDGVDMGREIKQSRVQKGTDDV